LELEGLIADFAPAAAYDEIAEIVAKSVTARHFWLTKPAYDRTRAIALLRQKHPTNKIAVAISTAFP